MLYHRIMQSPVGTLKLIVSDKGLRAILWENDSPSRIRLEDSVERPQHPVLNRAARQLGEYFAGERLQFDLDLDAEGTEFQKRVWGALLDIPFGETRSYADVASAIGNSGAVRAVGAASGRNPLSIVAPCHRVVGSDGSLTGFAGGIDTKRYLLSHERRRAAA